VKPQGREDSPNGAGRAEAGTGCRNFPPFVMRGYAPRLFLWWGLMILFVDRPRVGARALVIDSPAMGARAPASFRRGVRS
jgi:hypothetical protein